MRKALLSLLAASLLALGLTSTTALAAERTLSLDPAHTEVTFLLGATGHDVHGVLHLQEGLLRFDPAAHTASGDVVIDVRLAETGNAKRDKTMHAKVLNSASFPQMVFHARSIEGDLQPSGHSEITLVGTVTLLGKDHPLSLPTKVDIEGGAVSASSTFTVPFVDWGLHNPSTFILKVAKTVDVTIAAKGTLDQVGAEATGAGR